MPFFTPQRHHNNRVGLPWATYYVTVPSIDDQGYVLRRADGTYTYMPTGSNIDEDGLSIYSPPQYDDVGEFIPGVDYQFDIGREYYLSMREARQAIDVDGIHGISYRDLFENEFQDFFIVKVDGIDPEPYVEAHQAEPIQ